MRLGILADVHANLVALEAVITDLERRGVDGWICAGDLVGYGPRPDECVARVAQLGGVVVGGNHDLIALGRLPADGCTPFAQRSLAWTAAVLGEPAKRQLAALPATVETAGGRIVVAHGSLDDPREYVETPAAAVAQLARLEARHRGARLLVLGHTHVPLLAGRDGRRIAGPGPGSAALADESLLLNPGSAGQPRGRDPRARAAVVDLERASVELCAVEWDVAAVSRDLQRRGRPPGSSWASPPSMTRRAARLLRTRLLGGRR